MRADVKQQVQARFGSVAANYRKSAVHAAGIDLDLMVKHAPLEADSLVLDAGCGAGHTAMAFAPHAKLVFAGDFTPLMLEQVEALAEDRGINNVAPQVVDVEDLPFSAASLDIVATRYSAHHWQRPERALAECRRVLKEGGTFIISDIMAGEDYAQDTFLQGVELLRDPSHVRDYRVSEWLSMLAGVGFQTEVIHRFLLELHFESWIRRMETPRAHADIIKSIFAGAPADIKRAFQLPAQIDGDDFSFCIPGAVIKGVKTR